MFELMEIEDKPNIKVRAFGVGTVGCRLLSNAKFEIDESIELVYIHAESDFLESLDSQENFKIILRNDCNRVNNLSDANRAIEQKQSELTRLIDEADLIFVVAGLGGATGSGCSPYIAKLAKQLGTLCVGMFSLPFGFEGRGKKGVALKAYAELVKVTDSLLLIENDLFLDSFKNNKDGKLQSNLFEDSNKYFYSLIAGTSGALFKPSLLKIQYEDVRAVLESMGPCAVGAGVSSGENRAQQAAQSAIINSEKNGADTSTAKGILAVITCGPDFAIDEFESVGNAIKAILNEQVTVVMGTIIDLEMSDELEVFITLSGLKELPIDSDVNGYEFYAEVVRKIEFAPHQASAGLSILSYFGEIIKQKHSDVNANFKIEQLSNSVVLTIETVNGHIEKLEKTLDEYGDVIIGAKSPSQFLQNELNVQKLELKLETAALEIRQNERLLLMYQEQNSDYKLRLDRVEEQLYRLQKSLSDGLSSTNKSMASLIAKQEQLPNGLIETINEFKHRELPDEVSDLIERKVKELYQNDRSGFLSFSALVKNGVYGVVGNSMYSFLIQLINTVPK